MPKEYVESFSIRVAGKSMSSSDGYDIDGVISALNDAKSIVNKTYLALNNRERLTPNDKENLSVSIKGFKDGSLITDFQAFYTSVGIPVLAEVVNNSNVLWNTIKGSYDVLKARKKASDEGKEVKQEITENTGTIVAPIISGDNNTVTIQIPQYLEGVPEQLQPTFDKMSKSINNDGVSSISISSDGVDNIELDAKDRDTFEDRTIELADEFKIEAKILNANYSSSKGTLLISKSATQYLKTDETYKFSMNEDLHAEEKWKEMFLSVKPYYCKVKISSRTNQAVDVRITDWDPEEMDS
ncbi:hypothetical protein [Fructobacillus tropaeoli]|uniref:hypothetical protein n=1 Tax=Fructobacillus tropaeoli TaxID=709323 RepID=UPI0019423B00|nr:hypothetical protein [Fructobacillus tropaeoli]GIC70603.1 hypothetical protein FT12353_12790 [Fructobacillus tropaeoli]